MITEKFLEGLPTPKYLDRLLKCEECLEAHLLKDWEPETLYCEDCNDDHRAIMCPNCSRKYCVYRDDTLIKDMFI